MKKPPGAMRGRLTLVFTIFLVLLLGGFWAVTQIKASKHFAFS